VHSSRKVLKTLRINKSRDVTGAELMVCVAPLRAVARILTGDRERADDLAEKAIIQVFADPQPRPPGAKLKTWMFTILHNLYYCEQSRKRAPTQSVGDMVAEPPPTLSREEESLVFRDFGRAFRQLGDGEREVLILEGASGLSCEEVAKVCGCTAAAIGTRVSSARQKLLRAI